MIYRTITLTLLLALLVGCQTIRERKQADELQQVLRSYEAVIRWGSIDQARRFLPPDQTEVRTADVPRDMRVTHYEVVQGPSIVGSDRALQTAVIQYVFEESQVVRELVDHQTWRYDAEAESWYLSSPLPTFK